MTRDGEPPPFRNITDPNALWIIHGLRQYIDGLHHTLDAVYPDWRDVVDLMDSVENNDA